MSGIPHWLPPGPAEAARSIARRWHWSYYYFVLAVFDLVVIGASLALYDRILESYQESLSSITVIEKKQGELAELRACLLELNAPGNDIFESRDVSLERSRFEESYPRLTGRLESAQGSGVELSGFRRNLGEMVESELLIFGLFERLLAGEMPADAEAAVIDEATALMAAMDRAQADALASLVEIESRLRAEELGLLKAHGEELAVSTQVEYYFFGIVALILVGVFWYGRRLQTMQEEMAAEKQRWIEERHARLAAVGEVCASVAHAIRNPLAAIRLTAEVAQEEAPLGAVGDALTDVVAEAHRLDVRVRNLLDFSRPYELQFEHVDIRALVESVARRVARVAQESKVTLCVDSSAEPLWVRGDPHLLANTIEELASNAVQAMPDGGELGIQIRSEGAFAIVTVTDQGHGFTKVAARYAFELFFTTRPDGTGMGLANVKKVADNHYGTVAIMSTGPEGSVIRLSLPSASPG
jgi:signal transduction histidine kinase